MRFVPINFIPNLCDLINVLASAKTSLIINIAGGGLRTAANYRRSKKEMGAKWTVFDSQRIDYLLKIDPLFFNDMYKRASYVAN